MYSKREQCKRRKRRYFRAFWKKLTCSTKRTTAFVFFKNHRNSRYFLSRSYYSRLLYQTGIIRTVPKRRYFRAFLQKLACGTKSTTAFVFPKNHRNSRRFGLRSIAPAFLGENKARERVNTVCISREHNEVLVKNARQDHSSYCSRLA